MGGSSTKTIITYNETEQQININIDGNIQTVAAKEINKIDRFSNIYHELERNKEIELDFCIIPGYNGVNECVGLFDKDSNKFSELLDKYSVGATGSSCLSLNFRPGICINGNVVSQLEPYIINGNKCKVIYRDYLYDDVDLKRCCTTDDTKKCNENLINNYKTSHCNIIMEEFCKNSPEEKKCIEWLEKSNVRTDENALLLYSNYCKKNFESNLCTYMCNISRDVINQNSKYCDDALISWCNDNKSNIKCKCLLATSKDIPSIEEYIGPKECWLKECASERDLKWLTTEQLNKRKNCNITSCIISLDKLTMNDESSGEFINDCVQGTKITSTQLYFGKKKEEEIKTDFSPGILLSVPIGIFSLCFLFFLNF